jgi:diketogulonate reductase-like aldo/keto reductase
LVESSASLFSAGTTHCPVLGLGTAAHGDGNTDGTVENIVADAAGAGIRLFDTAQNYGSEAGVGAGLAKCGVARDSFFLSCKVDLDSQEDPVERMRRQVNSSLANLQTSYLDSVIIHWPVCLDKHDADHKTTRKLSWQALEHLVDEGLVRSIGVSNWTPDLMDELLTHARIRPSLNQVEFSPAVYQKELLDYCTDERIMTMGYSHYGMCWLAMYVREESGVEYAVTDLTQDETVGAIANEISCTPAQALLRWSMQHGVIVIPKTSKLSRVEESKGAFDISLSAEQMERMNALSMCPQRGTDASIRSHLRVIKTLADTDSHTPT